MNEIHPFYLIIIFIAFWAGASCLISVLGGWFWLAKRFPARENMGQTLQNFTWKSLNLNYITGYGSCVNFKIAERGIILKTSLLFSILHNPIFIPWASISNLTFKKGLFKRTIIRVGKSRLVVYGKVANAVDEIFSNHR